MLGNTLEYYLMLIPAVLIAIIFHELAHGLVAYALGDNTARNQGRLTVNPIPHIDPIGALCMVVAGIGWAKPVPVNPYNFKMKNRKLGMALVALAGPVANMLLAFVLILIVVLIYMTGTQSVIAMGLISFLELTAMLSVGLAAFNLLPIPPLDGSKVVMPLLPQSVNAFFYNYQGYITFGFFALLWLGFLNGPISAIRNVIMDILFSGVGAILTLFGVF